MSYYYRKHISTVTQSKRSKTTPFYFSSDITDNDFKGRDNEMETLFKNKAHMDPETYRVKRLQAWNIGVEKLGSVDINFEMGGMTDDIIINTMNNPDYYESDYGDALLEATLTIKDVDFMYIDEGLNELVFNELNKNNISRQDLQFTFDQTVSSSPIIPSKYKMQLINAFENLMAGKRKVIIQFNSKYPDGITLKEIDKITYYNFDRYGEFLIKVE